MCVVIVVGLVDNVDKKILAHGMDEKNRYPHILDLAILFGLCALWTILE